MSESSEAPFSGLTAWGRHMETPLRSFLRTETGSASVLAGATVAALVAYDIETLSKAVTLAVARAKISA